MKYKKQILTLALAGFLCLGFETTVSVNDKIEGNEIDKPIIDRVWGEDRYKTGIEISKNVYKDGADFVILANSEAYADALSASQLVVNYKLDSASYKKGGPILLVENDQIREEVLGEIQRLNPKKIFIVGGDKAVSESLFEKIKEEFEESEIIRLGGKDRFETNQLIINEIDAYSSKENKDFIYAYAHKFADALSAGGLLVKNEGRLILSPGAGPKIEEGNVIGGLAVMQMEKSDRVNWIYGEDRYETSLKIAKQISDEPDTLIIASGLKHPDALGAISLSKDLNAPIILNDGSQIDDEILAYVKKAKRVVVVGGKGAISDDIINKIKGERVLEPVNENSDFDIKAFEEEFLRLVNEERTSKGISPLETNVLDLKNAVAIRKADLKLLKYLNNHKRPDGTSCFNLPELKRHEDIFICGENLAVFSKFSNMEELENYLKETNPKELAKVFFDLWKKSKDHYENMMSSDFKYQYTDIVVTDNYKTFNMPAIMGISMFAQDN